MANPLTAFIGSSSGKATMGGIASGAFTLFRDWRNRKFQEKQNEKDRLFQKDMYAWSHKDAVDDWTKQNEYNSPVQQMQRLKEAGLNPHLVYGNGADATAGPVRAGAASGGSMPAPKMEGNPVADAIGTYQSLSMTDAQEASIRANISLAEKEGLLKDANTAKVLQDTSRSKFDLEQAMEVRQDVVRKMRLDADLAEVNVEAGRQSIGIALRKDEREALANAVNVEATVQSILESKLRQARLALENAKVPVEIEKLRADIDQLRTMTQNAKTEGRIRLIDEKLREQGLSPSDPVYVRALWILMQTPISDVVTGRQPHEATPEQIRLAIEAARSGE